MAFIYIESERVAAGNSNEDKEENPQKKPEQVGTKTKMANCLHTHTHTLSTFTPKKWQQTFVLHTQKNSMSFVLRTQKSTPKKAAKNAAEKAAEKVAENVAEKAAKKAAKRQQKGCKKGSKKCVKKGGKMFIPEPVLLLS